MCKHCDLTEIEIREESYMNTTARYDIYRGTNAENGFFIGFNQELNKCFLYNDNLKINLPINFCPLCGEIPQINI
jgi:hypothetical protein